MTQLLLGYLALALLFLIPAAIWAWQRWRQRRTDDPAWRATGIKPAERTWSIDRDHDDPRARKQLMAEVKARRVQSQRQGQGDNVAPFERRRGA